MSIRKKLFSVLSAAAVAASMAAGTVFAKDTGITGIYYQGTTIRTFLDTDLEGYESITLDYQYLSEVDNSTEAFGLLAFDSEWQGWNKTSVGVENPVVGTVYTDTITFDELDSSLGNDKSLYGFNLIADNFGEGQVQLNSVELNDKKGKEVTITGPWTKGTEAQITVAGDTKINVDANPYNIYVSGFSAYGFINPVVDVTVDYGLTVGEGVYKEATLYYVDNYNTDQEVWTPVEENTYKKIKAGEVTYSYQIDDTRHSFFACFDACTVKEIKIHDKMPDDINITGSWTKGTESEMTSTDPDVWLYAGADNIYVFNFSLKGYLNPTVEVTAEYAAIPDNYVQAELYSEGAKIGGDYIPVESTGQRIFSFDVSDDLTSFNVCFDGCTVTNVKIYDNRSPEAPVLSNKTASEITASMGKAWNLGNALDCTTNGTVGETLWNNKFPVSKPLFDAVKAAGFKTVRIPVSYMDKIVYENGKYTVDDTYMARVKQVVDLAIDSGLLVVIDIHHDGSNEVQGKWLDVTKTGNDFIGIKDKFSDVWADIAVNFADYDQRLLFEGFNELNNGSDAEPSTTELNNVNVLNNAFVSAVRSAGGKNADRVLIVNGYNADIDYTVSSFTKPSDTSTNRLMLSVHYYDPYDFTLNENGTEEWDEETQLADIQNQFNKIANFASTNGVNMPVFIGEYGAINKDNDFYRQLYLGALNQMAKDKGIITCYWDNGFSGQYGFALFDRETYTLNEYGETLISIIIE